MGIREWIGFALLDFVISLLLSLKIAENEVQWIIGWFLIFVLSFMTVLGIDLLFF